MTNAKHRVLPTLAVLGFFYLSLTGFTCAHNRHTATTAEVLLSTTNNFITDGYAEFESDASTLEQEVATFCQSPSETTLTAARNAWLSANSVFMRIELIRFGPIETESLSATLNFWPVRANNIESVIDEEASIEADEIPSFGASVRGLPTLEYLLYGDDQTDSEVLNDFAAQTTRCELLNGVATDLTSQAQTLHDAWSTDGGNFAAQITEAGTTSEEFPTTNDAISTFVNQMTAQLEVIRDTKISKPTGIPDRIADTDLVEAKFSGNSLINIADNLEGIKAFYVGTLGETGDGLENLITQQNAFTSQTFLTSLDELIAILRALDGDVVTVMQTDPDAMQDIYDRINNLHTIVVTEISGLLGATAYFSGNDGD